MNFSASRRQVMHVIKVALLGKMIVLKLHRTVVGK